MLGSEVQPARGRERENGRTIGLGCQMSDVSDLSDAADQADAVDGGRTKLEIPAPSSQLRASKSKIENRQLFQVTSLA